MLTLVIAEAEVELVPAPIASHPVIVSSAKKRGKSPQEILLDSNYHHTAMRTLKDAERRGRPDIAHITLLCALESVLNKRGLLRVYIHTRNDEIITIDPKTRLPRSYNRFCGLMEQVLKGSAPNLFEVERKSLNAFLDTLSGEKVVMHKEGEPFKTIEGVYVVGGFPHGDFKSELPYRKYSLSREGLTTWTVVNEVVVRYEQKKEDVLCGGESEEY